MKVIRIDTAASTMATSDIVRFTYNDGETTYATVDSFPSKEILVRDATAERGFIPMMLASARGQFKTEPQIVEVEQKGEWVPLWVDNTLKAV